MSEDYYKVLGVTTSATAEEIRRAYRILARRYHPDVNPGKTSEEKFKLIAEAFRVLSDSEKRREYDSERARLNAGSFSSVRARGRAAYAGAGQATAGRATERFRRAAQASADPTQTTAAFGREEPSVFGDALKNIKSFVSQFAKREDEIAKEDKIDLGKREPASENIRQISVIEVSVSLKDAALGGRKTIELPSFGAPQRVSVTVPPGTRSGNVMRLKPRSRPEEEVVLIFRVAQHHGVSIQNRGLVVEIPVTLQEAILGATIRVPTFEDEVLLKIPQGSQSGAEFRIREKGIAFRDGTRGDLFVRLLIKVPDCIEAVGFKEKIQEIEAYYEQRPRHDLPATLNELLDH